MDKTFETIEATSGWYYISKTRFHKPNRPLWVGPFDSEERALKDAQDNDDKFNK